MTLLEQHAAAVADLRRIQAEKAGFEIFCLALATLIGFLAGMMI